MGINLTSAEELRRLLGQVCKYLVFKIYSRMNALFPHDVYLTLGSQEETFLIRYNEVILE